MEDLLLQKIIDILCINMTLALMIGMIPLVSYVVNIIITHSERALFDLNARVEAQGGIVPEAVGI